MNNTPQGNTSIWPAITIVLAVITLGVAGWAALLQNKNRGLQEDVRKLRSRVEALEGDAKTLGAKVAALTPPPSAAGPSARRRRAAAAATQSTTAPTTAPATVPVPPVNPPK